LRRLPRERPVPESRPLRLPLASRGLGLIVISASPIGLRGWARHVRVGWKPTVDNYLGRWRRSPPPRHRWDDRSVSKRGPYDERWALATATYGCGCLASSGRSPLVGRLGTSATPERLEEEAYEQAGGNDQPLRLGLAPKEVTNIELFIEQILRAASADYLIVDAELPGNEPLGTQQGGASLKPYRTDPGQRAVDCRRYRQGHAAPDACAIRSGLRGRD
jgi:hypothetical protein